MLVLLPYWVKLKVSLLARHLRGSAGDTELLVGRDSFVRDPESVPRGRGSAQAWGRGGMATVYLGTLEAHT